MACRFQREKAWSIPCLVSTTVIVPWTLLNIANQEFCGYSDEGRKLFYI
jgi:hypothetical protein